MLLGVDVEHEVDESTLEPGTDTHMKVDTTITNNGATDLNNLVGDWVNGGGELEQWSTPGEGVGAALFDILETLSFFGFGENIGIDYQYVIEPFGSRGAYLLLAGVSLLLLPTFRWLLPPREAAGDRPSLLSAPNRILALVATLKVR